MTPSLGVLISGRGSNLQALIDAVDAGRLDATIRVVASNRTDAPGLERARRAGIETFVIDHRRWASRDDFDRALAQALKDRGVTLVCLAGFMRLLGRPMIDAFPAAILNIHPSLLPAFPGMHAQRQALDYGVKVSGLTVHFVDEHLDAGAIVLQRVVPVQEGDTEASLSSRILDEEHRAYPEAVAMVLGSKWRIEGRRFVIEEAHARG